MKKGSGLAFAFILVLLGTLGLLGNEYWFEWGRTATLIFAALNIAGLAGLAVGLFGRRKG